MTTKKANQAPGNNTGAALNIFSGNIYELLEKLKTCPENDRRKNLIFSGQKNEVDTWEKMLSGCNDLFTRYEKSAVQYSKIQSNINAISYQLENEGLLIDIDAFLTGQPECFLNDANDTINKDAKDLKISLAAPHWVKENDIFERLIKIVAYIDALEAQGQRLNLYAYITATDPNYVFEVKIKNENEPLNISQLIFLLASPVLLRYAFLSIRAALYNGILQPTGNTIHEMDLINNQEFYFIPSISFDCIKNICCYTNKKERIFNYSNFDPENTYNAFRN